MDKINSKIKVIFVAVILGSAVGKLTYAPPLLESFRSLGYPDYLLNILGTAYLLGVMAII